MKTLRLGFIPLSDCAVLVAAQEKGLFRRHGLAVELAREASWANVRDKVAVGALDGAQMLAGMPIAATVGVDAVAGPLTTAFSLNLNGNAVTVSRALWEQMAAGDDESTGAALRRVVSERRSAGAARLRFAMVYPFATHNYELRYWMAAAGIDPDEDIDLSVIAPPRMVEAMARGAIDGFCVGEPWGSLAVERGLGRIAVTKYEIWNNSPEKVLAVRQSFAEREPEVHRALLRALLEAAAWCDRDENRPELARLLAEPCYVGAEERLLAGPLCGQLSLGGGEVASLPEFHVFHRYAANFPWTSHAVWLLTQMLRWGQIDAPIDVLAAARRVYRPDLHREAARDLGIAVPAEDLKSEGIHAHEWTLATDRGALRMGRDLFCDGQQFHPERALAYLARSEMRMPAPMLDALAALNS